MRGWRRGCAIGPSPVIEKMTKRQKFPFVCAPRRAQHAGLAAWESDERPIIADYRRKRDRLYDGLRERFDVVKPGGAFYLYPRSPHGTSTAFVAEAIRNNLLIIPGTTFSSHDTHFRVSYTASDSMIDL